MLHIKRINEINESMSDSEVPESKIKKCLRELNWFIDEEWLKTVQLLAKNNDTNGLEHNNISNDRSQYYTRLTPYAFCIDIAYKQARFTIIVNNWIDMTKKELINNLQKNANVI